MHALRRTLVITLLLVSSSAFARAQSAADPSGHWEGAIQVPGMDLPFQIDVAKNSRGELSGTMSSPAQNLKGLPLLKVVVDGTWITFSPRDDRTFKGELLPDGKSMSGEVTGQEGSVPFSLIRTGDARIEAPVKSAPIGKELEGTWNATLVDNGSALRLVLTMANEADGTASGRIVNLNEGGLIIPISITQQGSSVMLATAVTPISFSGALNAEGTELAGTIRQGTIEVPLLFRRAAR